MELRQVRYFIAVAEELNFSKAAKLIHIAQPALSQQVKSLELELGIKLLERTSRTVRLTEAGAAFYEKAVMIQEQSLEAVREAKKAAKGEAGHLSIGFVPSAMEGVLHDKVFEFTKAYPKVELELKELCTCHQLEPVKRDKLDICFVRIFDNESAELETKVFMSESYVLALPETHRLTKMDVVPMPELDFENLIFFPRRLQPKLHDAVISAFHQAGADPVICQEVSTIHTILALVAANMGVGLVPESSTLRPKNGIVFRPLKEALPRLNHCIVWKRLSVPAQNFVGLFPENQSVEARKPA